MSITFGMRRPKYYIGMCRSERVLIGVCPQPEENISINIPLLPRIA